MSPTIFAILTAEKRGSAYVLFDPPGAIQYPGCANWYSPYKQVRDTLRHDKEYGIEHPNSTLAHFVYQRLTERRKFLATH